jgi:hypothetical protein
MMKITSFENDKVKMKVGLFGGCVIIDKELGRKIKTTKSDRDYFYHMLECVRQKTGADVHNSSNEYYQILAEYFCSEMTSFIGRLSDPPLSAWLALRDTDKSIVDHFSSPKFYRNSLQL